MLFGLKMSQDIFPMCMDHITDNLQGIITIHDDICVFRTPGEHNRYLIQLKKTALQNGIIFSSSKHRIRQPEISFYGALLTSSGIKPNPTKVPALQDLPIPDNQMKLQSFLGLINYLQPFIPCLANKKMFL